MSGARPRGPIVIDTDVYSADLVPGSKPAELYVPVMTGRPAFVSFQTVTELRYGALRRGWGATRMLKLDTKIQIGSLVDQVPAARRVYLGAPAVISKRWSFLRVSEGCGCA